MAPLLFRKVLYFPIPGTIFAYFFSLGRLIFYFVNDGKIDEDDDNDDNDDDDGERKRRRKTLTI